MTTHSSTPSEGKLTYADLQQFTGDLERYFHPLNRRVIYTPGVRYLAQAGDAYWLIDAITSYFGSRKMTSAMYRDERLTEQQYWRLTVDDGKGSLVAYADKGETPFIEQDIPYTDFPLEHVEIWAGFDGRLWTLYLPSEH
jgi:hypothetical protein